MKLGIFLDDNVERLANLYKSQGRLALATELEWDFMILNDSQFFPPLVERIGRKNLHKIIGGFTDCIQPISRYIFGYSQAELPYDRIAIQAAFYDLISTSDASVLNDGLVGEGYMLLAKFLPDPDGPLVMDYYDGLEDLVASRGGAMAQNKGVISNSNAIKRIQSTIAVRERLLSRHVDVWSRAIGR